MNFSQRRAARRRAVLEDADLLLGVGHAGAADGPVRHGDVLATGERLAVLGGPRHGLELVAVVVVAVELGGHAPQVVHHRVVVGDGLVVPEDRVAVLEVVHELPTSGRSEVV